MNAFHQLPVFLVGVVTLLASLTSGHGRLWAPPGRNTAWRRGFDAPRDYNDNAHNCGGLWKQASNNYQCGVCGDPAHLPQPRPNEVGGAYVSATDRPIVAKYRPGESVTFVHEITSNHKGWVEFKICPTDDLGVEATQTCLDKHRVKLDDSDIKLNVTHYDEFRYKIPTTSGKHEIKVIIPDVTCDLCVLQWHYHAGNNWGCDPAGKPCGLGYGYQEEFYACSDIKIVSASVTQKPQENKNLCRAIGYYTKDSSIHKWCQNNCPKCCPSFICSPECRQL